MDGWGTDPYACPCRVLSALKATQLSLAGRKLRCVGIEQVAFFGTEDNGSAACQRQLGSQVFCNQKLISAI